MPCPFCGTSLTIPPALRWQQTAAPEPPTPETPPKRFDPFQAAEKARFTAEQAEKAQAETEFVTNALRQVQPIAAGAVSAYGLWLGLKRFLPACLTLLAISCLLACGVSIFLAFFLGRGN
ncbi:MAG: hypothetical protein DDG60_09375 [Anaerolineae bacterium]|nr:MAG: hypothetical protein DDG60_09375 [Anaerolineae bacterium]